MHLCTFQLQFHSRLLVYSVSILYQRGIYPADSFKREQFYDMTLFKCDNKEIQEYLAKVLQQVKGTNELTRVSIYIIITADCQDEQLVEPDITPLTDLCIQDCSRHYGKSFQSSFRLLFYYICM